MQWIMSFNFTKQQLLSGLLHIAFFLEVHCDNPKPPENGYIQGTGPYKAGDVVQFHCNPDFMMEGQPIIACQENSRWSGKLPKCK